MPNPLGVLLMAYGTPKSPERQDVAAYYTHIRHGRAPSSEQLDDLVGRYRAIGGSPLFAITAGQRDGLQALLDDRHGAGSLRVYLGLKHAPPFIADAMAAMAADGVREAVALVLAPHYSSMSVGVYLAEAHAAALLQRPPLTLYPVRQWHLHPGLTALWADRITAARARFTPLERESLVVIFSAHSLPERLRATADPYPAQVPATGHAVARLLGLSRYTFCWQSAGRTSEPWMGPDILEKLSRLRAAGNLAALVCPTGFVADHLEVLYDLDVAAKNHASRIGLHFERTAQLNTDPRFLAVLADVVADALAGKAS